MVDKGMAERGEGVGELESVSEVADCLDGLGRAAIYVCQSRWAVAE